MVAASVASASVGATMSNNEHEQKVQYLRRMQMTLDKLETASLSSERRFDARMSLPQDWLVHAHDRLMSYDERKDELAYETNRKSAAGPQ